MATDDEGNLYIADANLGGSGSEGKGQRVRKVDSSGIITTFAGTGISGFSGDGGLAEQAQLDFPQDVAVDGGALYVADRYNHRIRSVDLATGIVTSVVGVSDPDQINGGFRGDGHRTFAEPDDLEGQLRCAAALDGPCAEISQPLAVAFDQNHNLYIADSNNGRIRKVTPGADGAVDGGMDANGNPDPIDDEIITTVAGGGSGDTGDGGPARAAALANPSDVAVDAEGNLYIADAGAHRVRKVTAGDGVIDGDDIITTVAGTGSPGFSGDGKSATSAQLRSPQGVEVDAGGNLFISDSLNERIRRVDAAGRITTVAGTGERTFSGDGGPSISAAVWRPARLHLDPAGNLAVADFFNKRVRKMKTALLWTEDSPDPTKVGEPFSYRVTVGGLTEAATGVILAVDLAPQVSFLSATASQGSCMPAASRITCELGSLAMGATASATIEVNPTGAGIMVSSATLSSNEAAAIPYGRTISTHTRVSAANCGQVIVDTTTLANDVGPCAGNGVIVGADGVTLDLGGHRVFGFPGPADGESAGIRLPQRSGVTITNGTVSDFDAGVALNGGGGNTITNLVVRDNLGPDRPGAELGDGIILLESSNNTISNNQVLRNGFFDGIGVLGEFADGNRIEGNVVEENVGPADRRRSDGQGIIVNAASLNTDDARLGQLFIDNTHVVGNVVRRNGAAGISNVNSLDGSVVANVVENNGLTNLGGNGIGVQLGPEATTNDTNMLVQGNEVHGNGWNGISIPAGHSGIATTTPAIGNQILDNDVGCGPDDGPECMDNNARPEVNGLTGQAGFDLRDGNPDCKWTNPQGTVFINTWLNNSWGSAGYSPLCTTAGAPETTITAGPTSPTNDATPTFKFSTDRPTSGFTCRIDAEPLNSCTSPYTTPQLADGPHSFEVSSTDTVGNSDATPARADFTVDTTPPDTTIIAGPSGPTTDDTATFEFVSSEAGSTFECRVDSASFSPCTSPHTTAPLTPGPHTFEVTATDAAGNIEAAVATRSFSVESAPAGPSLSIGDASIAEGNRGTRAMSFVVSLSSASTRQVSVKYATANGTATAKADYNPTSGTLKFAAGERSKIITVSIKGDTIQEAHETFFVNLSSPTSASIGDGQGRGTIQDDDS